MRLKDKVAIVTGAASGIGLAIAQRFAAEGASLIIGDLNEAGLNAALASITASGGTAAGKTANVALRDEAESLVALAESSFGRVDVLVNNAGVMDHNHGAAAVTDEMWARVIGVNLNGPMYLMRRALPGMLERGAGSIVNIASTAALNGSSAGAAYTVSKHGLAGLTVNTAWQYATKGIRCNAICPGGTRTNIVTSDDVAKWDKHGSERITLVYGLLPVILEPEDIANFALFLASDEARHVNGVVVPVDGGWLAS